MIGFIYIMSNPAHPDIQKIGQTAKDPEERRKELGSTGVLEDFVLEYRALSEDYESLEREIHRSLSHLRYRQEREFFTISVPEAIDKIREVAGSRIESDKVFYVSPEELQRIKDEKQRKAQEEVEKRQKIAEESKKREDAEEKETKKRKLKERERKFAVMAETRKKQAEEELEKKRQYNRIHRRLLRVIFFPYFVWTEMNEVSAWRGFIGFLLCFPYFFFLYKCFDVMNSMCEES